MARKQKQEKALLRRFAHELWSRAVRDDWGNRCAVCGAGKCDAHHIIPCQHEATRYSLRNGIALCGPHHQFDPDLSPHQNAAGWIRWLESYHPELAKWYVNMLAGRGHKSFAGTTNLTYYRGVIRGLKPYVSEDDYLRIVGIQRAAKLEELGGEA